MEKKRIAVIASRLKCVDAISIEADKWTDKYLKLGHSVHLIAGKFGEPVQLPHLILPEMDYKHPEVRGVKRIAFGAKLDKEGQKAANILLYNLSKRIKGPLKRYLIENKIDVLSVEDALCSLKNLPLSMALSEIVHELGINTIDRVHYLPWNNAYFTQFDNVPKLLENIPAKGKNVVHVTNTPAARASLKEKKGIDSKLIPNMVDLEKLHKIDDYNRDFRQSFGIRDDQLIFLQPTRVKRNKAIEQSIKLVSEINDSLKKDNVIMLTGSPVYSRQNYFEEIVKKVKRHNVNVIFADDKIFLSRHQNSEQKFYSIHDAYVHADVVLYPSTSDAFGNPIIEAAAYRKPLVVNKYPNLAEFSSKGFKFVVMDQKVTPETVSDTCEMLMDPVKKEVAISHNLNLVRTHYSSALLDQSIQELLSGFDREQGIVSRFTNIWSSRIFRKDEHMKQRGIEQQKPQETGKIKKEKELRDDNSRSDNKQLPYETPKQEAETDLRNKKGSYKEPKSGRKK